MHARVVRAARHEHVRVRVPQHRVEVEAMVRDAVADEQPAEPQLLRERLRCVIVRRVDARRWRHARAPPRGRAGRREDRLGRRRREVPA